MQLEDKLFRNRWLEANNTLFFSKFSPLVLSRGGTNVFFSGTRVQIAAQKCFATLVTCNKHERARKFGPLVDCAKFPSTFELISIIDITSAIRVTLREVGYFFYILGQFLNRDSRNIRVFNTLCAKSFEFFLRNEGEEERKKRKRRKCGNFSPDFLKSFKKKVFIFFKSNCCWRIV